MPVTPSTLSAVSRAAARLLPPGLALAAIARAKWYRGEPEMHLLTELCDRRRIGVDVGANAGVYTWHMRRLCRGVVAYEPIPELASGIRAALPGVTVHECALSDVTGEARLAVPVFHGRDHGALAGLGREFPEAERVRVIDVPVRRLDDESLLDVGFVKIDVEGHERKVLEGARALLTQQRPNLLVEIEERHAAGSLQAIVTMLESLNYAASYLRAGELQPVATFDIRTMQDPANMSADGWARGTYINNFVFRPVR